MQLGGLAELVEVAEVAVPLAEDERQVVQDDGPVGILRGQAVQGSLEQVAGAIESSSVPRCLVDLAQGDAQVAQKRPLLLARREDLERALVGGDGCGEDAFVARLAELVETACPISVNASGSSSPLLQVTGVSSATGGTPAKPRSRRLRADLRHADLRPVTDRTARDSGRAAGRRTSLPRLEGLVRRSRN